MSGEGGKVRAHLVRPRRRRDGRSVPSRWWSLRFRLPGQLQWSTMALGVSDKSVAQEKLREFVREKERELAGVGVPRRLREAAERSLTDHLSDYCGHQQSRGLSAKHVYNTEKRLHKLINECSWQTLRDVTCDSFSCWLSSQSLTGKTLGQYSSTLNSFFNWLVRRGRVLGNPFKGSSLEFASGSEDSRRALTDDEVKALLGVAAPVRKAAYLVALLTGLRRGELEQLRWGDVKLDAARSFIVARSSITKNKQRAVLWLRDDAVDALRVIKPDGAGDDEPVFAGGVVTMPEFRSDLSAAGIVEVGEGGSGRVVFHSLRHTLATNLARSGVAPRVAMEVMRHSDLRLTMRTYTDGQLLPTREAMERLPRFDPPSLPSMLEATGTDDAHGDAHGDAQSAVRSGPVESLAVPVDDLRKSQNGLEKQAKPGILSAAVTRSHDVGEMRHVGLEPTTR